MSRSPEPRVGWAAALLLLGACGSPGDPDAGPLDDATVDAGVRAPDAGPDASVTPDAGLDAGPLADAGRDGGAPSVVEVTHDRELRAMWLTTVFGLDFPSRQGLTEAEARDELEGVVAVVEAAGLNAIFFQVRAEADALYRSSIEPWSRFLTGTQGVDPGYDPLAILVEAAHARGIEVHAWMNPYRAATSTTITTAPNHATRVYPEAAITFGGATTMDPSSEPYRAHVVRVVTDVVTRFDVDGVVFDDYFYPYPVSGQTYDDDDAYDAYVAGGGTLSKGDWRRRNVDLLVAAVSEAVHATKPWVRWGIAPFGIYRPGMPPGVVGLDAYEVLATDPVRWLDQGWVDYLAPQLYWPTTSPGQPFGPLVQWWAERGTPARPIIPTLALYRLGSTAEWTLSEVAAQVDLVRAEAPTGAGQTWFRYAFLRDDALGERALLEGLYATPARPPALPGTEDEVVARPTVTLAGGGVRIAHPRPDLLGGFAVYREDGGDWRLERWVPAAASVTVPASAGVVAISAIARSGAESPGTRVALP